MTEPRKNMRALQGKERPHRIFPFRSCTDSRSIQICESKSPLARRKIAGILCVFQDFSTQPAAIWTAKLGAKAIGTASKPQDTGRPPAARRGAFCVWLRVSSVGVDDLLQIRAHVRLPAGGEGGSDQLKQNLVDRFAPLVVQKFGQRLIVFKIINFSHLYG